MPNTGRRLVARVTVIVSGGDHDGDPAVIKLKMGSLVSGVTVMFHALDAYRYNSTVEGVGRTATQAYGSNRGFAGPPHFINDPEHARNTVVR